MQWLASVSVRRPVFATVMVLAICVLGIVGYFTLGVDRFPKVDMPMVSIVTRLPGAMPDQMETDVTDHVEEAVNTISNIEELRSVSSEGVSMVFVQFSLEKDIDVASQEVRDKLSTVMAELPKDIEQPIVQKMDPEASPVLYLALRAEKPVREITEVADKTVRRQLQTASGVGQVTVVGGSERQVNVWIDPLRLKAFGLTASDVQRAVSGQNADTPGGRIEAGPQQLGVRIRGRVKNPDELGDLVLGERDGRVLRVRDVARIEDGKEIAETAAIQDGKPAVMLSIRKQSGSNSVGVVDSVKERIPRARAARGLRARGGARQHRDHSHQRACRQRAPLARRAVRGARRAALPRKPAQHADCGRRDPCLDRRHVCTDGVQRLHARYDHPARARARGRHRDRRRDRGAREHPPVHRRKVDEPETGRDRGHARDRARGARHDLVAARSIRPGGIHGRHRRPLPRKLRIDDGVLDRRVDVRELHPYPDALVALARRGAADRLRP
jgi:AcrB/AcrD/AcrF family